VKILKKQRTLEAGRKAPDAESAATTPGKECEMGGKPAASDVNRLWTDLHRIVSHHPLVRASRSAGLLVEEGAAPLTPISRRNCLFNC
jgi:hypothetical protein